MIMKKKNSTLKKAKTNETPGGPIKKRVLDGKRFQNLAILLKSLPELSKLKNIILKMDREQISVSQIDMLYEKVCQF